MLSDRTERRLERRIDRIEETSGISVVLVLDLNPAATRESNLRAADDLIEEWEIGGTEENGFIILISFDETLEHGELTTYAGAGVIRWLPRDLQAELRDEVMIPTFRSKSIEDGIVAGIDWLEDELR